MKSGYNHVCSKHLNICWYKRDIPDASQNYTLAALKLHE